MYKYRDTDIVSAEVREITPAMASEMLRHNEANRNLSNKKATYYARLMRDGSWKITHQGIAISEDGNIIDGQHRLAAVTMYGEPVKFLVTTLRANDGDGKLTAIGQPIDIGKTRSISDITSEPSRYVTIVRSLIRDYVPDGGNKAQDPEVVAEAINIVRPSLEELSQKCGTTRKGLTVATARGVIVLRAHLGINVIDQYRDALNGRYERLSKAWVSWATRMLAMAEGSRIPKNQDFREFVGAITWQVTDPSKDQNQTVTVKNTKRYSELISQEVQSVFFKAITK